jgi:hypothetical protein
MKTHNRTISLGFTSEQFEPGVHICQIFNDDEERHDALINYIVSGLQAGENTACFSENETESSLSQFFNEKGFTYNEVIKSGEFSLSKTAEVYFEGGTFEPQRMLNLLKEFYNNSIAKNRSGARVIGELVPAIDKIPGGSRLMEYESKVSLLLKTTPINAVCQYDARLFDGSTIMDILKVHPYMIVKGSVIHNPFFINPEEYLAKINCL